MSVAANDVVRATARLNLTDGQIAENVYHFLVTAANSDANVMSSVTDKLEAMYSEITGSMASSVTFLDIQFYNLTQNITMGVSGWPTLTTGSSGSSQAPPGVALLISVTTFAAKVLARKYLAGLISGRWTGSAWDSTVLGAVVEFVLAWTSLGTVSPGSGNFIPGVRDQSGAFQLFREAIIRAEAGYQRRRRQGVGI